MLAFFTLLIVQPVSAQWERAWHWTSGLGLQIRGAAGEIGRAPNGTGGHEDLIARLDGGLGLAAHIGYESRFAGAELRLSWAGSAVEVVNVDGVRFPNHGEPPLGWAGNIMVYPLGVAARAGRFQPFLVAGGGGMVIQVDLDNINGQTVYHRFQWMLGGGLRIVRGLESPMRTTTYVELRFEQQTAWQASPFRRFKLSAGTAGFGMRF